MTPSHHGHLQGQGAQATLWLWCPSTIIKDIAHRGFLGSPIPVLLLGKSHGQRSLLGYNPWGHKESDTAEKLSHTSG